MRQTSEVAAKNMINKSIVRVCIDLFRLSIRIILLIIMILVCLFILKFVFVFLEFFWDYLANTIFHKEWH